MSMRKLIFRFITQYLRTLIQQSANVLDDGCTSPILTGDPKVTNLYCVFLPSKENIAGLQISMQNLLLMQEVNSKQNL